MTPTSTPRPAAPARSRAPATTGPAPARRSTSSSRSTTRRPTSAPSVERLHAYLVADLPLSLPHHHRRQRQHRRHAGRSRRRARRSGSPGVARRPPRRRRAAAARCTRSGRRATPTVLAYMDVDLSTDLAALLPLVAPLLSGHSDLAIGTRLARGVARGARPEARAHLALLQPAAAHDAAPPASPTRSAASRRSAPTAPASCCRSSRTPAGSSTPSCSCSPSAPACASTRCRSTGSTTPTRRVDIVATAIADLRGIVRARRAASPPGRIPVPTLRGDAAHAGVPRGLGCRSSCGSRSSASRRRSPTSRSSSLLRGPMGAQGANLRGAAAHRRRQHRGQPPAHLRRARRRRPRSATSCRGSSSSPSGSALTTGSLAAAARARARRLAARLEVARARRAPTSPRRSCASCSSARGCSRGPRRLRPPARSPSRPRPRPTEGTRDDHRDPRHRVRAADPGSTHRARRSPRPTPTRSADAPGDHPTRRRAARSGVARAAALWRGRAADAAWVRPVAARPARRDRACSTCGASAPPAGPTRSTPPPSQAGSEDWKAFLFGSSDAANLITVDKPPASLWVMESVGAHLRR